MKTLFDPNLLVTVSAKTKLPLECECCHQTFYVKATQIRSSLKRNIDKHKYCSKQCQTLSATKIIIDTCGNCNKKIYVQKSQKKKSKSGKNFCSRSCRATYANTHKKNGNRRSKLEQWLEIRLTQLYPNLGIKFNDKETINSELDIYIPLLNLAFELNGIFHYEPIFGKEKLASIQNNDERKFQACLEKAIEFVLIDVSSLKNFKLDKSQKYLEIIQNIIDNKLCQGKGSNL